MSDSNEKRSESSLKLSELVLSAKSLYRQVEKLRRERFLREKVVDLNEYRKHRLSLRKKNILLVDDDEQIQRSVSKALEKYGYQVLLAKDAMELAKILESQSFDLILLDIRLSWVNGFELCSLMKSNKLLREIPIIFLSGEVGNEEIRKGFEAGCDEYITKPFDLNRFISTIRYFLESY